MHLGSPMSTDAMTALTTDSLGSVGPGTRCPCCGAKLPTRIERRFSILDAMTLVVASALAFALIRPVMLDEPVGLPAWGRWLTASVGVLVTWTPTVLWLRLRHPRPPLRRLARQPGFAASVVGTGILALGALATGLLALLRTARQGMGVRGGMLLRTPDPLWWVGVVLHFAAVVGPAVLAAWLILALSGRRRPARGWLDRLGRLIGLAWIVLFVINCCVRLAYLQG